MQSGGLESWSPEQHHSFNRRSEITGLDAQHRTRTYPCKPSPRGTRALQRPSWNLYLSLRSLNSPPSYPKGLKAWTHPTAAVTQSFDKPGTMLMSETQRSGSPALSQGQFRRGTHRQSHTYAAAGLQPGQTWRQEPQKSESVLSSARPQRWQREEVLICLVANLAQENRNGITALAPSARPWPSKPRFALL